MAARVTIRLDVVEPDVVGVGDHQAAAIGYAVLALARATRGGRRSTPAMTVDVGDQRTARPILTDRSFTAAHLAGLPIEQSPLDGSEIRLHALPATTGYV